MQISGAIIAQPCRGHKRRRVGDYFSAGSQSTVKTQGAYKRRDSSHEATQEDP